MSATVMAAVLFAALLPVSWNAVVSLGRGAPSDTGPDDVSRMPEAIRG
jgi:hypothetical protein